MDETAGEKKRGAFDKGLVWQAIKDAFKKLDPRVQIRNPVTFVVCVGALLTVYYIIHDAVIGKTHFIGLNIQIAIWLWITVLFADFAEAMAEGRGKAQAESLRKARKDTAAKKLVKGKVVMVSASDLRKDDIVLIEAGDMVPGDGEIIEGIASVDESVITGESAPVIRESGGDRSSVTGGSTVLSDWIKVRITANPGESFLDHMINLVEGAKRQKTPNEIAFTILLVALTIIFVLVCVSLEAFAVYSKAVAPVPTLIALAVCLAGGTPLIEVRDLKIDLLAHKTTLAGTEVKLTPTEYELLKQLIINAGMVLTHKQLLTSVWGPDYTQDTQHLRVYIWQLRKKLEADPSQPRYILTEPGVGYRMPSPDR